MNVPTVKKPAVLPYASKTARKPDPSNHRIRNVKTVTIRFTIFMRFPYALL
jgi:hypothetical protein